MNEKTRVDNLKLHPLCLKNGAVRDTREVSVEVEEPSTSPPASQLLVFKMLLEGKLHNSKMLRAISSE